MKRFQYNNLTVGSDPEFFITNKEGKLVSSIGVIEGTKYDPQKLALLGAGFAIQTDNVLGEFNIPCSTTAHEAANSIAIMKAYISGFLSGKDLLPKYVASSTFDKSELNSAEARMFGCSPDYNAWTEDVNLKPDGNSTRLRSAGCHFHVGYDSPGEEESINVIKALDLFLGVPSILIDSDTKRRSLYGKSGCFRFCAFGCEYRTMSGFMLSSNELTKWCFDQIFIAMDFLNKNGIDEIQSDSELIQEAINDGNSEIAYALIEKYGINLKY